MNYFWLDKYLEQWQSAIQTNHKPQAVIISGPSGLGKEVLLNQILADLVCREEAGHCGKCQNCLLFKQGHHPDINRIEPENELIKVKMIRELTQFFTATPHCSNYKIAVINDADNMNIAAANSLLKVLEEPPSRGILFLLTSVEHQLMPTIRSRCINMQLTLDEAERSQLKPWLAKQHGDIDAVDKALLFNDFQPLSAMTMLANNHLQELDEMLDLIAQAVVDKASVTNAAKKLTEHSTEQWELLQRYLMLLGKSYLRQDSNHKYLQHALNQIIKNSPKVFHIIIKIAELVQIIMLNLNTQIKSQLLIESMLIEIKKELNPGR
ncbi:hypothetical protein OS175_14210 [Marinicella sp. S1101]|uniref:hypothetical protein n=1 Tax=Marinicella marina TaxID=2996016 RepID=UPI002260C10D|nr:hypothetical protein [Marinicella marina]MCX7555026.1 hypothetical protein [Marinicella marina]MDJ1141310.1 hypothetical protein [Marinicella marina]